MSAAGLIHPSVMVTHIGGLNVAADTTLNLPKIPGGKKLIYTHIDMPLTAIEDFKSLGEKISDLEICIISHKHTVDYGVQRQKNIF